MNLKYLIKLSKMCFENIESKVEFQGTTIQAFGVNRDVKQGNLLPPTVFNLILEGIVQKADS